MQNKNNNTKIILGIVSALIFLCILVVAVGYGGYQLFQIARPVINTQLTQPEPTPEISLGDNPGEQIEEEWGKTTPTQEINSFDITQDLDKLFEAFWNARELLHDNFLEQPIDDQKLANGAIEGITSFLEQNDLSISDINLPENAPSPSEIAKNAKTPDDIVDTFLPFWETWNKLAYLEFPQGTTPTSLMRHALAGMVASLDDPYTNYFDPDLAEQWISDLSGEYEGIGAFVDVDGEFLTIISPIKDTPAEEAGLQPGDQIIAIDGDDMTGVDPNIALSRVLGKAGTTVTLTINRESSSESFDVEIIRRKISIPYIETDVLENDIAYLRLLRFYDGGDLDVRNALKELLQQNPKGLIIDLRGNPGGYLHTAVNITSEFLSEGNVLIEEFSDKSQKKYPVRNSNGVALDVPLVVLVDQGSASASQIFAGAIKDYGRGIIVGQTTFGKGLVQLPVSLPDKQGLMSITIARWLTPLGKTIHEIGIQPDFEVEITNSDFELGLDPQLDKAIELLSDNQ